MPMRRFAAWILSMMLFIVTFKGCSVSGKDKTTPKNAPAPAVDDNDPAGEVSNMDTKYKKLIFTDNIKKEAEVVYSPVSYERKVEPYKVNEDLSNIANLEQFGEFSSGQKALLSKNAFVVSPSNDGQLFSIYEKNTYLKLPSFITSDSILQLYGMFCDYTFSTLETDGLMKVMEELTASMLDKAMYLYDSIENPVVKTAAAKNAAYFAAAQLSLKKKLPSELPSEIKNMAEKEYALIEEAGSAKKSAIFPFMIDYSQFKPSGHYLGTEDLGRYFKAKTWYGQAPFPLYMDSEQKERDIEQTIQALLITYSLFLEKKGTPDIELGKDI